MAAGQDSRLRVGHARRGLVLHSGWLQLAVIVVLAVGVGFIAHFAGLPERLTPLVIGGSPALRTKLIAGPPLDDEPRDE